MAITTRDQMLDALANNSSRIVINKGNITNQTAGRPCSMWRSAGQPGQGAIPTTPALVTKALVGGLGFTDQVAPSTSYLAWLALTGSNGVQSIEIHDRIAHNGGLVLNVTTSQVITGLDLLTLAVPANRLGEPNYSDGQWFLEVYADGGATASNATINVTYDDGTTGNLNVQAVGGTIRAGNLFPLTPLIPPAQQGKFIRGINSVILSASTTVAGNFGFTWLRQRSVIDVLVANKAEARTYWQLGLPNLPNESCLQFVVIPSATSSGTIIGQGKIAHG